MRLLRWLCPRATLPLLPLLAVLAVAWRRRRGRIMTALRAHARLLRNLGIVATIGLLAVAASLRYGDTQSSRFHYLFQAYIWPRYWGGYIKPPADFTGIWRMWHPNGRLRSVAQYESGKCTGTAVYWHRNGRKSGECGHRDGLRHGVSVGWGPNGSTRHEDTYENGKCVRRLHWYRGGQKAMLGNYRDGEKHGKFMHWDEAGYVALSTEYRDGEKWAGTFETWERGKLVSVLRYRDGVVVESLMGGQSVPSDGGVSLWDTEPEW